MLRGVTNRVAPHSFVDTKTDDYSLINIYRNDPQKRTSNLLNHLEQIPKIEASDDSILL